jgi:uncharacterized YccA/Bax inhibitor family protein
MVESSNPVLSRDPWRQGAATDPYRGQYAGEYAPAAPPVERMTVDDVIMRTLALLGVVVVTGAASWLLLPPDGIGRLALFGALGVGLVLGLAISFMRITNPAVIMVYAAAEGVLLGLISRVYEALYSGIVLQAVVATFAVFGGMALLYRSRVLRATPKFQRWLMGAVIGVVALMLLNFVLAMFGVNQGTGLGLRDYGTSGEVGWLPIAFSLLCIGIAALTFVNDFAVVEQGVAAGADRRFAWYASFGILVGLIWLYLEIIRLLGYLRR